MVVSAEVLAHAMDKQDDAGFCLAIGRGPAIGGELPAVRGLVGEAVGSHHRAPSMGVAVAPFRPRSVLSKNCCDRSITPALPPHSAWPHIASPLLPDVTVIALPY